MEEAAAKLEFERAARIRDKIAPPAACCSRGSSWRARRRATSTSSAAAIERGLFAVNVVMIRGGRHVGDQHVLSAPRGCRRPSSGEGEIVPAFLDAALRRAPGAADDRRAGRRRSCGAGGGAVGAVGAQGGDRRQSRRRAPRVARDGAAERDARDPPEARAEGHAGGSARRAAGGARLAVDRCSASSASTSRTRWARRRSRRA